MTTTEQSSLLTEGAPAGMHWQRSGGMWRPVPIPERPAAFAEDFLSAHDFDRYATHADAYDGPLGICDTCGGPLETIGAVHAGRCSPCVLYHGEPTPQERAAHQVQEAEWEALL